eukprot:1150624-Pelagomonas_calceolata.AAC.5
MKSSQLRCCWTDPASCILCVVTLRCDVLCFLFCLSCAHPTIALHEHNLLFWHLHKTAVKRMFPRHRSPPRTQQSGVRYPQQEDLQKPHNNCSKYSSLGGIASMHALRNNTKNWCLNAQGSAELALFTVKANHWNIWGTFTFSTCLAMSVQRCQEHPVSLTNGLLPLC